MNTYTTLINKPPQHMPHTSSFTMGTHTIEIEVGKKYKKTIYNDDKQFDSFVHKIKKKLFIHVYHVFE